MSTTEALVSSGAVLPTVGPTGNGTPPNSSFEENDARLCYIDGRPEVCVRVAFLLLLGVLTGVLCLLRIIQYHSYKSKNYYQYALFYIAVLVCLLSIIHWVYVRTPVLDFINTYCIVIQLLIIFHFFCSWAFRILQKEKIFKFAIFPLLIVAALYFTAALLWAVAMKHEATTECNRPQWLLFTSSQLVMVQLFLLAVVYISRKLNHVSTARMNRLSQKGQLWGLAIVYEVVSVITFVYDLYLLIIARDNQHDCGTVITANNAGMTVIYITHKVVKYLLPQWSLCVIFSPIKKHRAAEPDGLEETETLSWAEKPNYQSTFIRSSSGKDSASQQPDKLSSSSSSRRHLPVEVHSSLPPQTTASYYSTHYHPGNNGGGVLPRSSTSSYQQSPGMLVLPAGAGQSSINATYSPVLPPHVNGSMGGGVRYNFSRRFSQNLADSYYSPRPPQS